MKNKRNVLFVVSEYGEFFNLVALAADMVKTFGIHPVFAFKADYGAIENHTQNLEKRGYSWLWENHTKYKFDMSESTVPVDDYVPFNRLRSSVAKAGLAKWQKYRLYALYWVYRIALFLIAAVSLMIFPIVALVLLVVAALVAIIRRIAGYLSQNRVGGAILSRDIVTPVGWRLKWMTAVFRHFKPALIISGQDYPLSLTTITAKVGEAFGIKTVLVPFSMTPTTKEIAECCAGLQINVVRSVVLRRLISAMFPSWLHRYRGRYYTRLPLSGILTSELAGLSPPEPWTPNSGLGIVMAPSQQSLDYCVSAGIPKEQLRFTGPLWSDQLLAKKESRALRRADLIRDIMLARSVWFSSRVHDWNDFDPPDAKAALKDDRKILIFSWPPNQWPRKASGYPTYEAFNRELVSMLAGLSHAGFAHVVISLHPTLVGTPYAAAISDNGLYITDASLIDVLDCADVFSATVSSTLLWSLQVGIPSVNFDIYRYGYREFTTAGMMEAGDIRQLRDQLLKLITNDSTCAEVADKMQLAKAYWTVDDGKSRERLFNEIDQLMQKPHEALERERSLKKWFPTAVTQPINPDEPKRAEAVAMREPTAPTRLNN